MRRLLKRAADDRYPFFGVEAGPGMADEEATSDAGGVDGGREAVFSDADADALVAVAVRRREEQLSGRLMRGQLRLVAGGAVVGLPLVAIGSFFGSVAAVFALMAGTLVLALTGLLFLRALDLSPATEWGDPVGEPCPACGERTLREDRVAVTMADGIVALCVPECGYADVRTDPASPPEPGGGRRLLSRIARTMCGSTGL
jgi:hypothetical protein